MNKTITILKHELRETLKKRSFIILTIALPLVVIIGMGIYQAVSHLYHPSAQETMLGYVDNAGLITGYTDQPGAKFIAFPNEADAKAALLEGDVTEYFVISKDYLSSGRVSRYTLSRDVQPSQTITTQLNDFLISNLLSNNVSSQVTDRVKVPSLMVSTILDKNGEVAKAQDIVSSIVLPIIFAIIFMISIFFASGFLFQSVTEEKENRIIEILLSSVSSTQLLVGKILGLGIAGLIQILVWLVTILIFSELAPSIIPSLSGLHISPIFLVWGLVYFLLGYLLFASLYATVGSIGSTAKEAQAWSMIFVLPAILPYYFSYFIISQPEGILSRVLTLFPLTSPMTAMMRIPSGIISAWEVVVSLVLLIGSIIFTMWLAGKIFRIFLLMYGKRPAVADIVRYVREA